MGISRDRDPEAEDADVIGALRAGQRRRALTLLMERYGERVYRYAFAMIRDRQLADEVRQQVFVEAYRDSDTFAGRGSPRMWLFGIARHRCLDAVKKHGRWRRRFKNDPPDEDEEEPSDDDPARQLDEHRLVAIVVRCLEHLPAASREAVMLRYHQELSYEEASRITGERAGTLQQRVARALPALRRCVDGQLRQRTSV
jgi:RNA polymerase sigma factor (sigma-70 family)